MAFEQYVEAYNSICLNKDEIKKKSDLHRFVTVLCEKEEFNLLHSFPFYEMNKLLEEVIYEKAKNSSISNTFYEILYSFYIRRSLFLKSSSIMYEFSKRIEKEGMGLEMLYKQRNALLSCLNSLKLVDEKKQWFFAPKIQKNETSILKIDSNSNFLFTIENEPKIKKRKYQEMNEIIKMKDIEKELLLIKCRIKLSNSSTIVITNNMNPNDIIGLLISSSFYDDAILVSNLFKIDKKNIFETLTQRCCISKLSSNLLILNIEREYCDIFENDEEFEENLSKGWKLIEDYLKKYDSIETNFEYHSIVLKKIISINHDFEHPNWLIKSFKKLSPSSLLRIYLDFSFLKDALILVNDFLNWKINKIDETNLFEKNVSIPFLFLDKFSNQLKNYEGKKDDSFMKLEKEFEINLNSYINSIQ